MKCFIAFSFIHHIWPWVSQLDNGTNCFCIWGAFIWLQHLYYVAVRNSWKLWWFYRVVVLNNGTQFWSNLFTLSKVIESSNCCSHNTLVIIVCVKWKLKQVLKLKQCFQRKTMSQPQFDSASMHTALYCFTMIHQSFLGRACTNTILVKLWNYKVLWLPGI